MQLGPYLLTECVGRGGMAAVYRAKRRGLAGFEKQVVVKTILPNLAHDRRFVRLFADEAKLSAQLLHNNIVRVNDFGFVQGQPFLELEYLTGWNLQQLWSTVSARGEQLPVAITLVLVTEICRGLAYAHSFVDEAGAHRPIIHRDVSPANVMICRDGSVKLLDFGLACLTRGETMKIDIFHGKIAYMSPEQLERRQLDRRADVFALGTLLHELLTGKRLFGVNDDDAATLRNVQRLVIDPPSRLNRSVPTALDAIVLRALRHEPDERYQSAAEMLESLEELSAHAASHPQLMRYLGSVGPETFTVTCDGCGARLPCGVNCSSCKTQLEEVVDLVSSEHSLNPAGARSPAQPPPLPASLSLRPPLLGFWLTQRLRVLQLMLRVLLVRAKPWLAKNAQRSLPMVKALSASAQSRALRWWASARRLRRGTQRI
jgi:serine/threonine-protein kinase